MLQRILKGSLISSMFLTGIASAQTTTTTTPGIPNTGAADMLVNGLVLGVAALIAIAAAAYLYARRIGDSSELQQ
jgi:hypothetical protein